jgi:transposase-like protein
LRADVSQLALLSQFANRAPNFTISPTRLLIIDLHNLHIMPLIPFLIAAIVLAITPGPGIAYVVARTVAGGRPEGLASCFGTGMGGLLHVLAAALGLSLLIARSAMLFSLVKYIGAAYLVYLGVRMLLRKDQPLTAEPVASRGARRANVEPGATVITDAWQSYRGLEKKGYIHDRRSQRAASARGENPGALLPGVHRIASLAKRWLLGTHQGAVDAAHLPSYLNEFVFRFNRRRSRSRGLLFYRVLELAVAHDPVRYQDLTRKKSPKAMRPTPPRKRGHPPSLERPRQNRPWRRSDSG